MASKCVLSQNLRLFNVCLKSLVHIAPVSPIEYLTSEAIEHSILPTGVIGSASFVCIILEDQWVYQ